MTLVKKPITQFRHLLLDFIAEPVRDLMPNHSFHLGPQISPRTPQNRSPKNKYQFRSHHHLVARRFVLTTPL